MEASRVVLDRKKAQEMNFDTVGRERPFGGDRRTPVDSEAPTPGALTLAAVIGAGLSFPITGALLFPFLPLAALVLDVLGVEVTADNEWIGWLIAIAMTWIVFWIVIVTTALTTRLGRYRIAGVASGLLGPLTQIAVFIAFSESVGT